MKKHIAVIVLILVFVILNAQSDKASKPVVAAESNPKIEVLDDLGQNKKQSIITAFLNKKWNGVGVLMGKKATFSMDWQKVLDNQFIRLKFQNKRKADNNEDIIFKATAFYKIVNDTVVTGHWFDNRGISFPLKGHIKENELTILWGHEETEMGKTIYRYMGNNTITTKDFIMNNGTYYPFGNATYNTID